MDERLPAQGDRRPSTRPSRGARALQTEGFGVLTAIDVKDTLHKKLGVDFRRYKILCACNPGLGHQALPADGPHAPVQRRGQPSP